MIKHRKFLATFIAIASLSIPATTYAAVCASDTATPDGGSEAVALQSGGNTITKAAQPFTVSSNCVVGNIEAVIKSNGTPTGDIWYSIYSSDGGVPDAMLTYTDNLAYDGTFTVRAGAAQAYYELVPSTQYWLVVESDQIPSSANFWEVQIGTPPSSYGQDYYLFNTTWTVETGYSFTSWEVNDDDPPTPPEPPMDLGGATSTPDQAQENLSTAFLLYFVAMFGMIWILRKH